MPAKLANVRIELALLQDTWRASAYASHDIDVAMGGAARRSTRSCGTSRIDIRDKERARTFDQEFIELARAVYVTNDERAAVKRDINTRLGSQIVEEKSYAKY